MSLPFTQLPSAIGQQYLRLCSQHGYSLRLCPQLQKRVQEAIQQHLERRLMYPASSFAHSLVKQLHLPQHVASARVLPVLYKTALFEQILRDAADRLIQETHKLMSAPPPNAVDFHFAVSSQLAPKTDPSGFADEVLVIVTIAWRTPELLQRYERAILFPALTYETLEAQLAVELLWKRIKKGSNVSFHEPFSIALRAHEKPEKSPLDVPALFENYELSVFRFPPETDVDAVYDHVFNSADAIVLHKSLQEFDVHLSVAVTLLEEDYRQIRSDLVLRVVIARLWRSETQYKEIKKNDEKFTVRDEMTYPTDEMVLSSKVISLKLKDKYIDELLEKQKQLEVSNYNLEQTLEMESERADLLEIRLEQTEKEIESLMENQISSHRSSSFTTNPELSTISEISSQSPPINSFTRVRSSSNVDESSSILPAPIQPQANAIAGMPFSNRRKSSITSLTKISQFFDSFNQVDIDGKSSSAPSVPSDASSKESQSTNMSSNPVDKNTIHQLKKELNHERQLRLILNQEKENLQRELAQASELLNQLQGVSASQQADLEQLKKELESGRTVIDTKSSVHSVDFVLLKDMPPTEMSSILLQLRILARDFNLPFRPDSLIPSLRQKLAPPTNPGALSKNRTLLQSLEHDTRRLQTAISELWNLYQEISTNPTDSRSKLSRCQNLLELQDEAIQRIHSTSTKLKQLAESQSTLQSSLKSTEQSSFFASDSAQNELTGAQEEVDWSIPDNVSLEAVASQFASNTTLSPGLAFRRTKSYHHRRRSSAAAIATSVGLLNTIPSTPTANGRRKSQISLLSATNPDSPRDFDNHGRRGSDWNMSEHSVEEDSRPSSRRGSSSSSIKSLPLRGIKIVKSKTLSALQLTKASKNS